MKAPEIALTAPSGFDGPVRRKHTDILFLVIIILSWVAMTIIGVRAVKEGNPDKLINGIDYDGRICGIDDDVKDKPNLYYIRMDGTGICVESCPDVTSFANLYACIDSEARYAVGGADQLDCVSSDALRCSNLTSIVDTSFFSGSSGDGVCMYQIESITLLNRCLFVDENIASQFVNYNDISSNAQQILSDIYEARYWILRIGFGGSFVIGFLYCLILQIPGVISFLTWGSIFGVIGLFAGVGYLIWEKGAEWTSDTLETHSYDQIMAAKVVGVIFFVFSALTFCFAIFMYRRIKIATAITKESARAIGKIPSLVCMPVLEALAIFVFIIPFMYFCEFSTEEGSDGVVIKTIEYNNDVQLLALFMIFCLFWTTQFILAVGQIVVALTIVKFFFSRNDSKVGNITFFTALCHGVYYHAGTAAFGSLIIAIIQTVRAVLSYVQKKAQASGNKVAEYVLLCLQCCLWCLEKCMKFINKNAYIQTAIFSTNFCTSAKEAFFLIARNILRVGAVAVVSEAMIVMMKLFICLATCGAAYLVLDHEMNDKLFTVITPTLFTGLVAYMVAGVFAELFNMTTSTLLQCFIADEEMFSGEERHARKELCDLMESHRGKKKTAVADT